MSLEKCGNAANFIINPKFTFFPQNQTVTVRTVNLLSRYINSPLLIPVGNTVGSSYEEVIIYKK